jgi:hypothetical protein
MTPAVCGRLIGLAFASPLLLWFLLSLTGLPVVYWPGAVAVLGLLGAAVWYSLGGRRAVRRLWHLHLHRRDVRDFGRRFGPDTRPDLRAACAASQFAGLDHLRRIAGEQAANRDTMPMPAVAEPSPAALNR